MSPVTRFSFHIASFQVLHFEISPNDRRNGASYRISVRVLCVWHLAHDVEICRHTSRSTQLNTLCSDKIKLAWLVAKCSCSIICNKSSKCHWELPVNDWQCFISAMSSLFHYRSFKEIHEIRENHLHWWCGYWLKWTGALKRYTQEHFIIQLINLWPGH